MAFYVRAWNLAQGDWEHRYGPFPGTPWITHNFIRDSNGNHIFCHEEEWDGTPGWYAQDDDPDTESPRFYGWRRTYDAPGTFAYAQGPFWTDMDLEIVDDDITINDFDNDIAAVDGEHNANVDYNDWLGYIDPEYRQERPEPTQPRIHGRHI